MGCYPVHLSLLDLITTLSEKYKLWKRNSNYTVHEKKSLSKMFGPKTEEVSEQFRVLRNEKISDLL
jgi:hypothetical protein